MDLNLSVVRQIRTKFSTIGEWNKDRKLIHNLYSIEDPDRGLNDSMSLETVQALKVYGETAIAVSDVKPYTVVVDKSTRFTKKFGRDMYMLHVLDPKGFGGIRIHPANKAADVLGCLGTGESKADNFVGASRPAYYQLLDLLKDTLGFTIEMAGTMPIIVPIEDFKPVGRVYLDIKRNYKL